MKKKKKKKHIMKAIIFSAGLGTRLKHLSENCPKALVKVNGSPLLWHAINKLIATGVEQIVVNTHHFSEQVVDYVYSNKWEVPISISNESDLLLDTGGGLLKASDFLKDASTIIAYNVDILSSIDLLEVIKYHNTNSALATLVVRDRKTSRYLLFDKAMGLSGWKNFDTGIEIIATEQYRNSSPFAFSGIQILSPLIFEKITETGKFSITKLYLRLAESEKIIGYYDQSDFWIDAGKPEQIEIAEKHLKQRNA